MKGRYNLLYRRTLDQIIHIYVFLARSWRGKAHWVAKPIHKERITPAHLDFPRRLLLDKHVRHPLRSTDIQNIGRLLTLL